MMTCLTGLQAPDLVCWADETGEIVIFNTHREKEVVRASIKLNHEKNEVVKKIIHTHPRSSKLFLMTQLRILKFEIKISDSRDSAVLKNLEAVSQFSPAEGGYIDMIYECSVANQENIYLID